MFTDDEKRIFEYHDGEKKVFGDPLELERNVRMTLGDPQKAITQVNAINLAGAPMEGILLAYDAQRRVAEAIREVFGLVGFDRATGKGCTDAMVFAVWRKFANFLDQKKTVRAS